MDRRHRQQARLQALDVVVQTEYQDGGRLKIRRSDGAIRDDVESGVILDKKYFLRRALRHQETEFNPGILYAFVFPRLADGQVLCPNCGGVGAADSFDGGCPYCGASYNLAYAAEDRGSRGHANYVRHTRDRVLPMVLSVAGCAALALILTLLTGRTLRPFDYVKGLAAGILVGALAGIAWIWWKSRDRITEADRKKMALQASQLAGLRQTLRAAGSSLSEFTNALAQALEDHFFGPAPENADVVDFDLLDYLRCEIEDGEAANSGPGTKPTAARTPAPNHPRSDMESSEAGNCGPESGTTNAGGPAPNHPRSDTTDSEAAGHDMPGDLRGDTADSEAAGLGPETGTTNAGGPAPNHPRSDMEGSGAGNCGPETGTTNAGGPAPNDLHSDMESSGASPLIVTALLVRVVRLRGSALRSEKQTLAVTLRKNPARAASLQPGANFRTCPNCGASLDLTQTHCAYCGAEIPNAQPFLPVGVRRL